MDSRIKIIKRIQKERQRQGQQSPPPSNAPIDPPPLRFSTRNHGQAIRISSDGTTACGQLNFGMEGIIYSSRPVRVDEKVRLRVTTSSYNGNIQYGFTEQHPSNKPISPLSSQYLFSAANEEKYLYYYLNSTGKMKYCINGENEGWFFSKINVKGPFWVFLRIIHGQATVQIMDSEVTDQEPVRDLLEGEIREWQSVYVESPIEKRSAKLGSWHVGSQAARNAHAATENVTSVGVAPCSSHTEGSSSVLPQLTFHGVHGNSLRILRDGSVLARIKPGHEDGEAFSARPVRVGEKVCLRFIKMESKDSNINYGFCARDPAELMCSVPKWRRKHCVWLCPLPVRFHKKDIIIHYHVNVAGEVRFGVNGEDKGVFFPKLDKTSTLWAMVELNGVGSTIEFVEPDAQIIRTIQGSADEKQMIDETRGVSVEDPLPRLTYQDTLIPLSIHTTTGRNIQLSSEIAIRIQGTLSQGYVFTAHPMHPSQTIVIQILSVLAPAAGRPGGLAYGLTSCDPAKLRQCDLPDDADQLLDRQEYWFVNSNAAEALCRGDELAITLTQNGEVQESKNSSDPITVMHVDHTLKLWAFVDLYETTQRVRMMTTHSVESPLQQSVGSALPRQRLDWSSLIRQPQETERLSASTSEAGRMTTDATRREVGVTPNAAGATSRQPATWGGRKVIRALGRAATNASGRALRQDVSTAPSGAGGPPTTAADPDVSATNNAAGRDLNASPGFTAPLSSRTADDPNLSPSRFHAVHGECIRISRGGTAAQHFRSTTREDACDAFSATPVRVGEKVHFRFVEISKDCKTKIHFGFTNSDPTYHTPWRKDWILILDEKFRKKDSTIYYCLNSKGMIELGVNGELYRKWRVLVYGEIHSSPTSLWPKFRIRGVGTTVQFVGACIAPDQIITPIQSPAEEERVIDDIGVPSEDTLPQLIYQDQLIPLSLHTTTGRNVQLSSEFVTRIQGMLKGRQGYVFTAFPMVPSQTIVIQILSVLAPAVSRPGGLAYGLTSCDPAKLRQCDLPDDADQLLDRQEYWVVNSNAAEALCRGDELAITLTQNGEVQESRNSSEPRTVMHVDHTLKLWAFVDLYETTQRVRMMTTHPVATRPQQSRVQEAALDSLERPSTSRQQPRREHSPTAAVGRGQESADTECSICFDRQVDCALYKCGHVCMCYTCAVQLWKDGGGRCPICRAQIMEVMRIFKS